MSLLVAHQNKANSAHTKHATVPKREDTTGYSLNYTPITKKLLPIVKMPSSKGKPTDPKLREKVKEEVKNETNKDGGGKGQWSAWKASLILPVLIYAANVICRLPSYRRNTRRREVGTRMNLAQRMSQRKAHHNPNPQARRNPKKSKRRRSPKAHRQRIKRTMSLHQANRNPKPIAARRRTRLLMRRREQLRAVLPRRMASRKLKTSNRLKEPVRAAEFRKRERRTQTMRSRQRRRRRRSNCTDYSMEFYETWVKVT
jgi:hypothetical protein